MNATPEPEADASSIDREFQPKVAIQGDPFAVLARCEDELRTQDRTKLPVEWANLQHRRAMALLWIGTEVRKTVYLEEAIAAFRHSLEVWQIDQYPHAWARAQNQIGLTLCLLGQSRADTAHLQDAVAAHRAALSVWTRARFPLCWSRTHCHLASALLALGRNARNAAFIEEAVSSWRQAQEEYTYKRHGRAWESWLWVTEQIALADALRELGRQKAGTTHLRQAAKVYLDALAKLHADPIEYGSTMYDLGETYLEIGARASETHPLKRAVLALRVALERHRWARDDFPVMSADIQLMLGRALLALGARQENFAHYRAAIENFGECLDLLEYAEAKNRHQGETAPKIPRLRAKTLFSQGQAQLTLGLSVPDLRLIKAAGNSFYTALNPDLRRDWPILWAEIQHGLGSALLAAGEHAEARERGVYLKKALLAFDAALKVLSELRVDDGAQTLVRSLLEERARTATAANAL